MFARVIHASVGRRTVDRRPRPTHRRRLEYDGRRPPIRPGNRSRAGHRGLETGDPSRAEGYRLGLRTRSTESARLGRSRRRSLARRVLVVTPLVRRCHHQNRYERAYRNRQGRYGREDRLQRGRRRNGDGEARASSRDPSGRVRGSPVPSLRERFRDAARRETVNYDRPLPPCARP